MSKGNPDHHIISFKVMTEPEYVQDDDLWLIRCLVDNRGKAKPDNEFYVRCTPCGHHEHKPEHYGHGYLVISSLPQFLIRKAFEIGIEVMSNNGLLPDSEEDDE